MNITAVRSDKIYRRIASATIHEREDIYRYELMKPFEFKWNCIGIQLKAEQAGGYDIISASTTMGGGYHPSQINKELITEINKISNDDFWFACEQSIGNALKGFEDNGIVLPVQNYVFTVLLNDPQNPMSAMTGDCCGDGGIPGYIIGTIIPNGTSLQMLPVVLSHETNHNVRWQFIKWNSSITLADMIISEGLAENFATLTYGKDKLGMWVKNTSDEVLHNIIKPAIRKNLYENDFNKLSAYLYGDEIMKLRGVEPVGMPYCAGYACGYHLIKYYLHKTGKNIYEATIIPTADILKETEEFWS